MLFLVEEFANYLHEQGRMSDKDHAEVIHAIRFTRWVAWGSLIVLAIGLWLVILS